MATAKKATPAKPKTPPKKVETPKDDFNPNEDNDMNDPKTDDDEDDFNANLDDADPEDQDPNEDQDKDDKEQAPQPPAKSAKKGDPKHFDEWRVEIKDRKVEKLKLIRKNVKISEEEAETLNHGAVGQVNADFHIMYFRPGKG